MNRIFRLVLNRAAGQWVPVSEATRGAAKGRRQLRSSAKRRHIAALALVSAAFDHSTLAHAAPGGAQVTAGAGTVSQTGNTTTIRQTSATLFLNWQSFNVTANEVVNFIQPNATSIAVNRILGNTSSQIFGHLDANGQVWLINPNGILFGVGAEVNVGGLTASTLDVSDASFSASLRSFSGPGTGSVINQGTIRAADGGYVALLGNQVSNQGVIRAQLGTVALGAGSAETLTFSGRQLIHLRVDQSTLNDLAANGQLIEADGGNVIMTAGAKNSLLASVVNNTGIVQARSVEDHNGIITLLAGMTAGQVNVGGTLDATAPAGQPGGSIETSGAAVSVASTAKIVAGPGGSWRIDPTDLTIDATAATAIDTSLNNGTNVTEATTATTVSGSGNQTAGPGDINVNAPIAWTSGTATLTLSAYNAINLNASVTGPGAVVMQAGAAINVNTPVNVAGSVLMQAGTGNLTIASGASIEGDAGLMIGTGANFINNSGLANALISAPGWRVYSTNPTSDFTGGLTPGFIQYGAAFGAAPASQATGNGLLYSVAPSITVAALTGVASKTYDGGTTGSLTAANSNYTVSGTLNGDTVNSISATYQTVDVGSAIPVTSAATAAGLAITNSNGIPVYGYALAGTPVTASIGTITAAQLSAAIVGDTANPNLSKVYDGTTTATLGSGNYQLTGFVTGQSASVNQPSSIAYASATAGAETLNATFAATNFVAASGTKLSNYILPTTATGSGTVLQAPLVITGVLANDKVYDATTTDTLDVTHAGMYGVIGSDAVSLSTSGATGTFSSPNVGNNRSVSTGGFALSGAEQNDYQLIAPSSLTASITPAPLTVTGVTAVNKVYDGTTAAALVGTPQLSGLLPADATTVVLSSSTITAAFSSKNVGAGLPVTTAGYSIAGTDASNYAFTQASGLTANITPAQLTVNLVGNPTKPYNGTETAALSSANFTVTGFVSGEGATIPQTSLAEYASPNAGAPAVTATLAVTDFATTGGALLSNYTVPTTATGPGTITPAPLTGMIVGNPSKVYDGTTSATLTGANYVLTGFLSGEGVTVNQSSGIYASANAGLQPVTATLSSSNYTGTGGTLLSNYSLPTTLTGTGTITQAPVGMYVYAGITNNPTKSYDGTTTATLAPLNFVLTGFTGSDGATVTQTVGVYSSANAGIQTVSAVLTNSDFTASGSTILSNYHLPTSAYGSGTISPVALSVAVVGDPTRVYNGATSTVLLSTNYNITGFATGEGAVINPSALINYGSANVGSQTILAALTPSAYTANSGTLMSNYVLASSASGTGTITAAPVYVTGVYATNKVYNTTYVDPLNTGSQALAGIVSTDAGNVSLSGTAAGAFTTNQVGVSLPVSVSGLSIGGTAASNYTLQPVTGLAASITPAPLTITGVSANSKPYDGTTVAALNTSSQGLTGLYNGDTVNVSAANAVGAFTSVNVGSNLKVNASGFVSSGAQASDYTLAQPSGLSANITQAPITAVISGNPTKVYDGSASTTLTNANYTLVGFATVGSVTQGASVPQSATASYAAPDAGTNVAIGSTLVLSDFIANSGTNLSNYALPTVGSGTGTITQAPLTATLIGNPTKTYDSTTTASLTTANYALSGFVGSQSATVNQASGTYASANAGSQSVTAALTSANYSAGSATNLANYALPASAAGTGTITRAPLTISVATTPQVYNGTTTDTLTGATLSGRTYGTDAPVLNTTSSGTGTLGSSGNAGTDSVTTAMSLTGAGSSNYSISQPTGLTAVISPAPLSATVSVSKTYDGTTSANLSGSNTTIVGFIGTDGATVNSGVTGAFNAANVGTAIAVTGSLTAGNVTATGGTLLSNYTLPASDNGSGSITAATLTYTATPSSQQYGLTPTGLTGSLGGFVNNETLASDMLAGSISGAMVFTTSATASSNVAHYAIDGSGLTANNYSIVQAAGNSTALTITKAPLTVSGVLTTSRTYNGSTNDALSGAAISGVIYNGDALTLTNTASGTLGSNGNVGTDAVTTSMSLSGTASGNYSLTQESGLNATISSLALTAVSSVTRSYTGTNVASLSGANTVITGFTSGQGATVNAGVNGTFATTNVAGGISITGGALTAGNLTATGSTVLANYTLPTSDNGSGTITPAIVNLTGTRVYDAATDAAASIFGTAGTVATGVGAETLMLSGSGTLAGKNVGVQSASLGTLALGTNGTSLASNYQLTGGTDTVTVTPLAITVAAAGSNKVYNGNVTAAVTLTSTGVLSGDSLTYADTAATFATKNVGNGQVVSVSGITESGTGSGNYTVNTTATTSANITPAIVNLTGSRTYDALLDANAGIFGTAGTVATGVGAETLMLSGSGTLAGKNVGVQSASLGTLALGTNGTSLASNYQLTGGTDTVTVTPLAITVAGTANSKTYDGTTAATLSALGSGGVLGNDTVNFADTSATFNSKNVTAATTVAIAGITASGADAANYTLSNTTATANANITPAIVNLTGTRVYDAATDAAASIFGSAGTVAGIGTETLTLSGSGTLAGKNVGTQSVTSASFGNFSLANHGTGASAGLASNYTLVGGADTVTVTPLAITVAGTANDKTYDGTTAATLSALGSGGVLGNDTVNFADTSATFNSKNVTAATTVTISGITASGADAANYALSNTTATANANITPAIVNLTGTRVYDAATDAAASIFGSAGTVAGIGTETLTLSGSGTLAGKNVGTQSVTSASFGNFSLANHGTGASAGLASNYTLVGGADTVTVTPLAITVAGTANDKTYDGTTAATLSALGSGGVLGNDTVNFADTSAIFNSKNVAAATTVAIAGITASGADAANYTLSNTTATASAGITPLAITVAGTANSKTYDGTTAATLSALGSGGVLGNDTVNFTDTSATFNSKNVTAATTVAIAGITASGADAANYTLSNTTATANANITPAIVNLTGTRVYDAATDAAASIFGSGGTVAGIGTETLTLSGSGTLMSKSAGTQGVSSLGSLALNDGTGAGAGLAGNYQLAGGSDVVTVTPLAITVTGIANNKTFDGTTAATLSALGSGGVIAGDTVAFAATGAAFADRNAANGKTVTISGITDAGADAGNYRFNAGAVTIADITPATLTETATPVSVASGQAPTLSGSVSGFVPGDTQSNATGGTLVWSTTATPTATPGSYAVDGSGLTAENYVLVQSAGNADALTITAAPAATAAMASVSGSFDATSANIATPLGVGSANDFGNNTGNARRDKNPTHGNQHLSDFTGHLAVSVIGVGIKVPAELVP